MEHMVNYGLSEKNNVIANANVNVNTHLVARNGYSMVELLVILGIKWYTK